MRAVLKHVRIVNETVLFLILQRNLTYWNLIVAQWPIIVETWGCNMG